MKPRKFTPETVYVVYDSSSDVVIGGFHSEEQADGVSKLHDSSWTKVYEVPMLSAIGTYDWEDGENDE